MKLTINRERNENGFKVEFVYDGKLYTYPGTSELYRVSRAITGHTSEVASYGIFDPIETVEIKFYDASKMFEFNFIDYYNNSLTYIQNELKSRAKIVREWIASISFEESATFEI